MTSAPNLDTAEYQAEDDTPVLDGRRDYHMLLVTGLGFVSGILCSVLFWYFGTMTPAGLIFGLLIGAYLYFNNIAGGAGFLGFAGLAWASWIAVAVFLEFWGGELVLPFWWERIGFVAAGFIGAVLLSASAAVAFPFFRRPGGWTVTILAGWGVAMLIAVVPVLEVLEHCQPEFPCPTPQMVHEMMLPAVALLTFPIWQAVFAYCFALGLPFRRR